MGRYVFELEYSHAQVTWEDGEIKASKEVKSALEDYNLAVWKSGRGFGTTGAYMASIPSVDYLKTPIGTYLLLNSIEPVKVIEGDIDEEAIAKQFQAEGEDEESK